MFAVISAKVWVSGWMYEGWQNFCELKSMVTWAHQPSTDLSIKNKQTKHGKGVWVHKVYCTLHTENCTKAIEFCYRLSHIICSVTHYIHYCSHWVALAMSRGGGIGWDCHLIMEGIMSSCDYCKQMAPTCNKANEFYYTLHGYPFCIGLLHSCSTRSSIDLDQIC